MISGCRQVLRVICQVQASERLAVVVDPPMLSIGEAFLRAADETGAETILAVIPLAGKSGKEPPARVAQLLRESDVFVIPTTVGITHTRARAMATDNGARGVTMPGVTEDMLSREALFADYEDMAAAAESLAQRLTGVRDIHLTSGSGTDLTFSVKEGVWFAEGGLCRRPGQFSNAPGGEVSIAPITADGVLVVDGSISGIGLLKEPLHMTIRGGWVTAIEGNSASHLRSILIPFGKNAFHVAEIGIGMNRGAKRTGKILEDEKALGTVHVGLGDNTKMGGVSLAEPVEAGIHIDAVVVSSPRILADGDLIVPEDYYRT